MNRDGMLPCGCFEGEGCPTCAPWSVGEKNYAAEIAEAAETEAYWTLVEATR